MLRRPKDLSSQFAGAYATLPQAVDTVALIEARRTELEASTAPVGDAFEALGQATLSPLGERALSDSSPAGKAAFLYRLALAVGPGKVVEFGSAFGVSGAYIVAGLQAAGGGTFLTIEAAGSRSAVAVQTIALVSAPDVDVQAVIGLFDDHLSTLEGAGLVFVDGNHQAAPTEAYVAACVSRAAPDAVLVLDDIAGYSAEMDKLWANLRRDKRFTASAQVENVGLLMLGKVPTLTS